MSNYTRWIIIFIGLVLLTTLAIMASIYLPRISTAIMLIPDEPWTLQRVTVEPSDISFESVLVKDVIISPLPTPKAIPTPVPTDDIASIPTSAPPLIPEISEKEDSVFWIYYWFDNEIWRVDSQGNEQEQLLDTQKELGQWLTDHPVPNSDCCWSGPRVVVSPDGSKLALVVVNKINVNKNESFEFSIYKFDIHSRILQFISFGVQPVWSIDSTHIAFLNQNSLHVADISKDIDVNIKILATPSENSAAISEYTWSHDNQYIAYATNVGFQRLPEIWLADMNLSTAPTKLIDVAAENPPYRLTWAPNNLDVFFLSSEGSRDRYPQNKFQNIYSVSLNEAKLNIFTRNMVVRNYLISPDRRWFALLGYLPHEQDDESYLADIWVQNIGDSELKRATYAADFRIVGWSPDGTRLLLSHQEKPLSSLSLRDGSITKLDIELSSNYVIGGLK